jgi:hypothetical protein
LSNNSAQEKELSLEESDTGPRDELAKSSDERLEQAEACNRIEETPMQSLVAKEESCMPPTSTKASEEDHDTLATE